jgi:hypothetical protein
MEMATIADPRHRADLALVMEELSGFATLVSPSVVSGFELEEALDAVTGVRPQTRALVPLLGRGVGYAFGRPGGLTVRSTDGTQTMEDLRAGWDGGPEAFDCWLENLQLESERRHLAGPSDADVPELVQRGWDPLAAERVAERRARQERELAAQLDADPRLRRGRLRDVVAAGFLSNEVIERLVESLKERAIPFGSAIPDRETARRLVDCMPTADVYVTLLTVAHRNPNSQWTTNDIFDFDALSLAVAYCDVVATDRERCHGVRSSRLSDRLNTTVVAKTGELLDALAE